MSQEQNATLAGLEIALQMEEDGKQFYLKAAEASGTEMGGKLLRQLAAEEDVHKEVFKAIYDKIKSKNQWPDTSYVSDHGEKLKTILSEALESAGKNFSASPAEIDAVKTAIDMENKTLVFYRERKEKAFLDAEKQLYDALAMQESGHSLILQDYFEFLSDPASYYMRIQHSSVDGG
jgi:rubrerythrin